QRGGRNERERHGARKPVMSAQGEHQAGQKTEREREVDPRKNEVPADEQRGEALAKQDARMAAERLDHAACPARALAHKAAERIGNARETDRIFGVADEESALKNRPGDDDVLADDLWPAADLAQDFRAVKRESALRNEGPAECGLRAFRGGDAVEIVPVLH